MMRTLLVLAYLFASLGAVAAALIGISFSETHRQQYPALTILHEEQAQVLMFSIVCWVLAYGAKLWGELLSLKPPLESVRVPGGQLAHKATRQGIEYELDDAEPDLAPEARGHLDAAERQFVAGRYRQAADSFQKSVDVLPTMSGYLNLGMSLLYVWEFRQAESVFVSGLYMARKCRNREFEGAFLNNLGNTYYREGKHERALESYRSALKSFEQTSDAIAVSTIFHNSGIVYHAQEKLEEALKSKRPWASERKQESSSTQ